MPRLRNSTFWRSPLRQDPPAGLVIDLGQVNGLLHSVFISLLAQMPYRSCKKHGSESGLRQERPTRIHKVASPHPRLDTPLWAIYDA